MPTLFNTLALCIAVLTAGTYWYGVDQSFFWAYWWYDIPLHLLGGLVMGLWACAVGARLQLVPRHTFLLVLFIVLLGGIVWEVFEVALNLVRKDGYWVDTVADLGNDIVGGMTAWILYRFVYKKSLSHGE